MLTGLNAHLIFGAIFPAALKASILGSSITALYVLAAAVLSLPEMNTENIGLTLIIISAVLFIGTLVGTLFTAVILAVIGAPVAYFLRDHLARPIGTIAFAMAAAGVAIGAALLLDGVLISVSDAPKLSIALVLAYAIPASLIYRRDIVFESTING
ncbi:MAG: hypothetical protein ABJ242_05560 [Marinomonas sp.]